MLFPKKPIDKTYDGEVLEESDGGELLLGGSHEVLGDGGGGRHGSDVGAGGLDALGGEATGDGRLVKRERKRHGAVK